MSFAPASPITGATVPGFTTPTYTVVSDQAMGFNGKQFAVTALGGTQVGVTANSVSSPFTLSFYRPVQLKVLPPANPITGIRKNVPMNSYKLITRKGVTPASNASEVTMRITTVIDVPAGADTFDPAEIKAALSLHAGALSNQSSGIADTVITGVL